ncbi:hypothetical protein ACX2QB_04045 [Weissella viridescens]
MNKIPGRMTITPLSSQFGVDPYYGVWGRINGVQRNMVQPDGIHLMPEDFSDISLPAINFIDDQGVNHQLSITNNQLLTIDDESIFDLKGNSLCLSSPNGQKYRLKVSDTGELGTEKVEEPV